MNPNVYRLGLFFEDEGEPVDLAHPMVTTFQLSV